MAGIVARDPAKQIPARVRHSRQSVTVDKIRCRER